MRVARGCGLKKRGAEGAPKCIFTVSSLLPTPHRGSLMKPFLLSPLVVLALGSAAWTTPAFAQYPIDQEAYIKSPLPTMDGNFGRCVAMSETTLVVGSARWGLSVPGVVQVYERVNEVWVHQTALHHPSPDGNDRFGFSVAIDGDLIVVGTTGDDSSSAGTLGDPTNNSLSDSGAAVVFARSGGYWSQVAYLKASTPDIDDEFGHSVAVQGDTIVVGAHLEGSIHPDSGAAYVFVGNGASWSQQAFLKASDPNWYHRFGAAVALDQDSVVIGAWHHTIGGFATGAAYVFERTGTTWTEEAFLTGSNSDDYDQFGRAVDISGDCILVAAPTEGSFGTGVNGDQTQQVGAELGAVYVFERNAGVWTQSAYVKPNRIDPQDRFGNSVAIVDRRFVVGANSEDSGSIGINGQTDDASASASGAAYYFTPEGASWKQEAYIKPSNTDAGDSFGQAVDLHGDQLAVGGYGESSAAPGLNGDQSDNSLPGAGAVYLFDLHAPMANFCGVPEPNSSGYPAAISMTGSLVVADDDFTLQATSLPQGEFGFFLNSRGQGFVANPGASQGHLCLGGDQAIGRHNRAHEILHSGVSGVFSLHLDLADMPTPTLPVAVAAGETWNFQAWFRDTNPGSTSNFTDGLSVTYE